MEKTVLDVTGLLCPLPVLKAKKSLRMLSKGASLQVLTTDKGAVLDFQCLCEEEGLELLSQEEADGTCIHLIKKV